MMDAKALAAAIMQAKSADIHQMKEEAAQAITAQIDALKAEKDRLRAECDTLAAQAGACAEEVDQVREQNRRLRIALHDAIRRPLGVTPDSALEFYSQRMADEAEEQRSKWSDRSRPAAPPGILVAADPSRPTIAAGKTRVAKARRTRPATPSTGEG